MHGWVACNIPQLNNSAHLYHTVLAVKHIDALLWLDVFKYKLLLPDLQGAM